MFYKIKRILIGKPLRTDELHHQKLSNAKALAILSSDALSSVAYRYYVVKSERID